MTKMMPYITVAVVIVLIGGKLPLLLWLILLVALAVLALVTAYFLGALPYVLVPYASMLGLPEHEAYAQREDLTQARLDIARQLDTEAIAAALNSEVIGQHGLAALPLAIKSHLLKANPDGALAVLICGRSSTGKSRLASSLVRATNQQIEKRVLRADKELLEQGSQVDWEKHEQLASSEPVYFTVLEDIEHVGHDNVFLRHIKQLLDAPAHGGCILVCTMTKSWNDIPTEDNEALRNAVSSALDPSLVQRFNAILQIKPIEAVNDKITLAMRVIDEVAYQYGIEHVSGENAPRELFVLLGNLVSEWDASEEHAYFSLRRRIETIFSDELNKARTAGWQSVEISAVQPSPASVQLREAIQMEATHVY